MGLFQQKLKEIGASLREGFRAIVWGQFFNTSLQTQLSILQILRNLFLRIGTIDNRLRIQEFLDKQVLEMVNSYLKAAEQRMDNLCHLEQKAIDHLQTLLRRGGIRGEAERNIHAVEIPLIEFLFPWLRNKTVLHIGEDRENFVEAMLSIGFQRVAEPNFKEVPSRAGLLKIQGENDTAKILQSLSAECEILLYECPGQTKALTFSQQAEGVRHLRDIGYPFFISLVCVPDGGLEFAANILPKTSNGWRSTFCFRESFLFEKAYAFVGSQLPMQSAFGRSPDV